MSRLARLEWAMLSALCLLAASADPAERLIFSAAILAVSLTSHFIFYFFRKLLTPVFQILFLLAVISTLFEALYFLFPFSFRAALPQAIFPALLLSISSSKASEKFEICALFLIFNLVSVLIYQMNPVFSEFYPVVFMITAAVFVLMSLLRVSRKKSK